MQNGTSTASLKLIESCFFVLAKKAVPGRRGNGGGGRGGQSFRPASTSSTPNKIGRLYSSQRPMTIHAQSFVLLIVDIMTKNLMCMQGNIRPVPALIRDQRWAQP